MKMSVLSMHQCLWECVWPSLPRWSGLFIVCQQWPDIPLPRSPWHLIDTRLPLFGRLPQLCPLSVCVYVWVCVHAPGGHGQIKPSRAWHPSSFVLTQQYKGAESSKRSTQCESLYTYVCVTAGSGVSMVIMRKWLFIGGLWLMAHHLFSGLVPLLSDYSFELSISFAQSLGSHLYSIPFSSFPSLQHMLIHK